MKKNDWLLIAGVLSYSYLFYEQFAGINFLVFTLILIATLWIRDGRLLVRKSLWLPLAGSVISALCICIYGDELSVFANICSLSFLSIRSLNHNDSLFSAAFHAAYSYVSAPVYLLIDGINRLKKIEEKKIGTKRNGLFFYLIPLAVFLLFFGFYRNSSSLFKNLTDHLRLDFISFSWIFFTIGGLILLYGFYYRRRLKMISDFEEHQKDTITQSGMSTFYLLGYNVNISTEQRSGIMMFILLNLLIFVVNVLDVQFLVLGSVLPEGMNYSELVHQGIGSLVMSIIVAIAIILWYFRGEQNFIKGNTLKLLALIWIVQNVIMIGFNVHKNTLYIEEYNLTCKRIGVYIYLLLAVIGLITTAVKIRNIKSNWYLFKVNIIAGYIVLLAGCLVNWDLFITKFNIKQAEEHGRELDARYLGFLSASVIPDLYTWMNNHKGSYELMVKEHLDRKILDIVYQNKLTDWRSWSMERSRIAIEIDRMFASGVIDSVMVFNTNFIIPYPEELRSLSIKAPYQDKVLVHELDKYSGLQLLDISHNNLRSIQGMPEFKGIRRLNVSDNMIPSLDPVKGFSTLEVLDASSNNLTTLPDLSRLTNLKSIDLSYNNITRIEPLARLTSIENISLYNNSIADFTPLMKLPNLRTLRVQFLNAKQKTELQKALPHLRIMQQ